ncbi:MAG TPA: DUF3786 domain-containing protein [Desulfitobacteriaceae bacterium]|nr:DUF3786 domain-containing protein [Desulfitobacteriaceae bacterium]
MNYAPALQMALKKFQDCSLEDIKQYSGYSLKGDRFQIDFLGQQLEVEYPSGKFLWQQSAAEELPVFMQILILHYLADRTETVRTGKLISFKELSGGNIYIEPFNQRAVLPLARLFGSSPRRLLEVAARIGGKEAAYGDAAVTIDVFPRIPVTLILWGSDEEFGASANILFDASAARILPTEDYAVLASCLVAALKRLAG